MKKTIRREMAITQKEFLRLLPSAVNGLPCKISGSDIHIREESSSILITMEKETTRTMASLRLPVTHLILEFSDFDDEAIRCFLQKFDLAYHKGGG